MTGNIARHSELRAQDKLAAGQQNLLSLLQAGSGSASTGFSNKTTSNNLNEPSAAYQASVKATVSNIPVVEMRAQDKPRRQSVAESRAVSRLQKILQLLPAGVVVLDYRGHIVECNELAEDILGADLPGSSWRSVIDRAFMPRSDDGHEISLKDGRRISLSTRSLDDEPGQLILLTDLTETRKLQQQVSRNERLTAMGKMVSSLAHQIRTPLSAAMLYSGNLQSASLPEATVNRFATKIQSRLQNMERQVRDMLLFAKGEVSLDRVVSTEELFAQVECAVADMAEREKIQFEWSNNAKGARLLCNEDAITGALLNLIENSVQASSESNRITLRSEVNANTLRLVVTDEGPGVSAELAGKVTEEFVTTKPQGTGLGLAVANMVAKAHKGQFFFHAHAGRGVEAGLELPLARAYQANTEQGK